jgi:hypothetical protein
MKGLSTLLKRFWTNVQKGTSGLKNMPDMKKNIGMWKE